MTFTIARFMSGAIVVLVGLAGIQAYAAEPLVAPAAVGLLAQVRLPAPGPRDDTNPADTSSTRGTERRTDRPDRDQSRSPAFRERPDGRRNESGARQSSRQPASKDSSSARTEMLRERNEERR